MFILRNKRKESGLSLIEVSLVIILSGLVIVLVQSAISKIIKYAVHENALHDVSYVMSYIQDTLQTSCYGKENIVCDGVISSVKSNINSGNKIKVDVKKDGKYVSVYILYTLSGNEYFGRNEDFGSMLFTHVSAYSGRMDSSTGVVSSVLGWWKVNSDGTIFSGGDNNKNLFFYNNFRVDVL